MLKRDVISVIGAPDSYILTNSVSSMGGYGGIVIFLQCVEYNYGSVR
jgi:hypothetical protein